MECKDTSTQSLCREEVEDMVLARAANGRGWRICEMCPVVALYFRCAEGNIKDLNATAITIYL